MRKLLYKFLEINEKHLATCRFFQRVNNLTLTKESVFKDIFI